MANVVAYKFYLGDYSFQAYVTAGNSLTHFDYLARYLDSWENVISELRNHIWA